LTSAEQADFTLYDTAKCGCEKFVLDIVDETWYHELKDEHSGYALLITKAIFDHIAMRWDGLTKSEASDLPLQLPGLWDTAGNVVVYFNMMQDLQK
jgi:hypothetical protein